MSETLTELFGESINVYSRAQAIDDGELVDLTEWASADKGFHGGFTCPVVVTRALWDAIERKVALQDTRGRAHDVLWMASLACRSLIKAGRESGYFAVLLQVGRKRKHTLRVVMDGDGVTVGFPEDF